MLNIVVPMAGAGSRFASAGYMDPKPLIPLHGIPMIKVIIDNLRPTTSHRFIFICQRTHSETYDLESRLQSWAPGCIVFLIDGVTQGAACTVLTVKHLIDHDPVPDYFNITRLNPGYFKQVVDDVHQVVGA